MVHLLEILKYGTKNKEKILDGEVNIRSLMGANGNKGKKCQHDKMTKGNIIGI